MTGVTPSAALGPLGKGRGVEGDHPVVAGRRREDGSPDEHHWGQIVMHRLTGAPARTGTVDPTEALDDLEHRLDRLESPSMRWWS